MCVYCKNNKVKQKRQKKKKRVIANNKLLKIKNIVYKLNSGYE